MDENIVFEEKDFQVDEIEQLPASMLKRFLTLIVDMLFLYVFAFVLGFVLALLGLVDFIQNMNDFLLGLITVLAYYVPQESIYAKTLGKKIIGTTVINERGVAPSTIQVFVRTLLRFIPFEAFSFLGGKGRPVGWHDRLSGTKVISIKK